MDSISNEMWEDLEKQGGQDSENALRNSCCCPLVFSLLAAVALGCWDRKKGRRKAESWTVELFFFQDRWSPWYQDSLLLSDYSHNHIMKLYQVQVNSSKSLNPLYVIFLSPNQFFVWVYPYLLAEFRADCLCDHHPELCLLIQCLFSCTGLSLTSLGISVVL